MSIQAWLKQAIHTLSEVDIPSAKLDAELILAHVLSQPREYLLAHSEAIVKDSAIKVANALIQKRSARHPLVHLTGHREFYGLDFEITPDVLTPRVETEPMVDMAIKQAPDNGSLVDVGTGSGAIAVAIAKQRPDLEITASDISSAALAIAQRNAQRHKVPIKLVESDLWNHLTGSFDVVTANLPYLTETADLMTEVQKEPRLALVGGATGLELYERFFSQLSDHLKSSGIVFIEADPWQHADLAKLAQKHSFTTQTDDYFIMSLWPSR